MFVKRIELKDFRNYKDLDVSFNKNVNIFIGNNAQGKTNLLESIYLLTGARSCSLDGDPVAPQARDGSGVLLPHVIHASSGCPHRATAGWSGACSTDPTVRDADTAQSCPSALDE